MQIKPTDELNEILENTKPNQLDKYFNELYAKNTRDACLIVAINNRIFDLDKVNAMLVEKGLKPLEK